MFLIVFPTDYFLKRKTEKFIELFGGETYLFCLIRQTNESQSYSRFFVLEKAQDGNFSIKKLIKVEWIIKGETGATKTKQKCDLDD